MYHLETNVSTSPLFSRHLIHTCR